MKSNDKILKLLEILVQNDRGELILTLKEYGTNFSTNELWSLALEPKLQLRERVKDLIEKEIDLIKNDLIKEL